MLNSKNDGTGDNISTTGARDSENSMPGPRERILEASLKLFVEQGYFNTNVPDISKSSRCSIGSIYHHFLNKEEIARLLYEDGIRKFRGALTASISPDASLEQTIQAIVIAFLGFAESHHMLSRYLWLARHNEFLNHKISMPTVVGFDSLGRKLTRAVKGAVRRGEIHPIKAQVFWTIVFGIPLSYIRDWLDGYMPDSPSQVAPTIAKACWAALCAAG